MHRIVIFTDGACSGNPGPGGWGAVVGLPDGAVRELGGGEPRTTNNRMELSAALEALRAVSGRREPIDLYTDSTYLINGAVSWMAGWRRRGWTTAEGKPVLNQDLWSELSAALEGRSVKWHYVRGHQGTPGNERCDRIAASFAAGEPVDLYAGSAARYPVDLEDLPDDTAPPARRTGSRPAAPEGPASYLSLLDGRLERHATWRDCEARVKGRSGARFKKVRSPSEEQQTLRAWGLS